MISASFKLALFLLGMALIFPGTGLTGQSDSPGITVCWDVSQSMAKRDMNKDLGLLGKIFERHPDADVQLLQFGTQISEAGFKVRDGDWSTLEEALRSSSYDGVATYEGLAGRILHRKVYFFTDGNPVTDTNITDLPQGSFIVVSSPDRNSVFLERTALLNRARVIDFNGTSQEREARALSENQGKKISVTGRVWFGNRPAEGVLVYTKQTGNWVTTDSRGEYRLEGKPAEEVIVRMANGEELSTGSIEGPEMPPAFLDPKVIALDEVVLTKDGLEEEVELVQTSLGLKDKKSLGYAVAEVDQSEISEIDLFVDEALGVKVPGVKMPGRNGWPDPRTRSGFSRVEIRGRNTWNLNPYALIVLDGIPLARSNMAIEKGAFSPNIENFDLIDPGNIKTITVLKGLAATNIYGSEGGNGVILITTKTGTFSTGNPKGTKKYGPTTEKYEGSGDAAFPKDKTSFVLALEQASDLNEAYKRYLSWREIRGNDAYFYLEAYEFFALKDAAKAFRILSNLAEDHPNEPEYLKIVAMGALVLNYPDWGERLSRKLLQLKEDDPQDLLNLAISLRQQGKARECHATLSRLENLRNTGVVFSETLQKSITREWADLLRQHRSLLSGLDIPARYQNAFNLDARLSFQWNRKGEPLALRFVHPNKHFFDWSSREDSESTLNIGEFEIYGKESRGQWLIQSRSERSIPHNMTRAPLVLRATLVKDFGKPTQKVFDKLVYLPNPEEGMEVLRFRL